MSKRFLQLPGSIPIESIAGSVRKTGGPEIGDRRLAEIKSTYGSEEVVRIINLALVLISTDFRLI